MFRGPLTQESPTATFTHASVADVVPVAGWGEEVLVEEGPAERDAAAVGVAGADVAVNPHRHHRQHSGRQHYATHPANGSVDEPDELLTPVSCGHWQCPLLVPLVSGLHINGMGMRARVCVHWLGAE